MTTLQQKPILFGIQNLKHSIHSLTTSTFVVYKTMAGFSTVPSSSSSCCCQHSVCRTCALHYFTLQYLLWLKSTENNNDNEANLILECSFCCSNQQQQRSVVELNIPRHYNHRKENNNNTLGA